MWRNEKLGIAKGLAFLALGTGLGMVLPPKFAPSRPSYEITGETKAAMERLIHTYILEHPEIVPEAIEKLQERSSSQQLDEVRPELEKPYAGAVLGNPNGAMTLVQFTDYACGFCRQSVADVDTLIAANPDLKVVVRELPILGLSSTEAAKAALTAAGQGKYAAFHNALFAGGPPSMASIARAASMSGVNLNSSRTSVEDDRITSELRRNAEMARQLKLSGTPSWIIGNEAFSGAVGLGRLAESLQRARQTSHPASTRDSMAD